MNFELRLSEPCTFQRGRGFNPLHTKFGNNRSYHVYRKHRPPENS